MKNKIVNELITAMKARVPESRIWQAIWQIHYVWERKPFTAGYGERFLLPLKKLP